jgi:hypothetical protein
VLALELEGGEHLRLHADATHRLPVIRVRGTQPLRLEFAACRLRGQTAPAGWCELADARFGSGPEAPRRYPRRPPSG